MLPSVVSGGNVRGPTNKLSDRKIGTRIKQARKAATEGYVKPVLLGDGGGLTVQIGRLARLRGFTATCGLEEP
jgi:hypothetical protein